MNLLIIGGTGYVGTNYINKYSDTDSIVTVDISPKGDGIEVDITKPIDINVDSLDGIIHLAGISRVKDGESDPRQTFEVNVQGTVNVLDYAVKNDIPWVLMAGTIEGEGNAYGLSKRIAKDISKYYSERGLKIGVLNFSSIYSGANDNKDKLIYTLIRKALNNEDIQISNAGILVDLISVNDVVRGIRDFSKYLAMSNNSNYHEFSLCSGRHINLKDLANLIIRMTKSKSRLDV